MTSFPLGSVGKALHPTNSDSAIWHASYKEEYDGLSGKDTYDIIDNIEYNRLSHAAGGKGSILSMCVFTVKKGSKGHPVRAKSRIVVLGNKDPTKWTNADCFAPVVSFSIICFMTALVVKHRRTLKQGNCKLAFVQATLPPEEMAIIKPPMGCPFTKPSTYWKLKKSLYELKRAP
jgi:hypothetical protein